MARSHILIGISCLTAFSISADDTFAQQVSGQEEGSPTITFGISSTLSSTDNESLSPAGGDYDSMFGIGFDFRYLDRRANDVLTFVLDGGETGSGDTSGRLIDNQRALLAYDRGSANSTLSLGAEYNFAPVDDLDPFDDEPFLEGDQLDSSDLVQDQGNRQQIAGRFSYVTGLNDPIGQMFEGRYRDTTYQKTTDPDLFDTEVFNLSGTTRLRISPVTEARFVLRYEDYQAKDTDRTHRQTSSANLGLTQALSSTDSLDVSLGLQNIKTEETVLGVRQTDNQKDVIGSFNFTRELLRGSIGTAFDVREGVNGRTTTWLIDRALVFPRGQLDISFGAASDVDGKIHPVADVGYLHKMQNGTFSASLSRDVTTSTQSDELLTTQASLGYKYEINSLSDLDFSVDYAALDQAGGPAVSDGARADLRVAYSRDLTRDWQLSSGYEYRMRKETGVETATSNRVFITLRREIIISP